MLMKSILLSTIYYYFDFRCLLSFFDGLATLFQSIVIVATLEAASTWQRHVKELPFLIFSY